MTRTVCAGCGVPITPNLGPGRARKWCSDWCRKDTLYGQSCVDCGKRRYTGVPDGESPRCTSCNAERTKRMTLSWMAESLEEWVDLFGVPPTVGDWSPAHARQSGQLWRVARTESTGRPWPSQSLASKHFGGWPAFLKAHGYDAFGCGHYGREGEYVDTSGAAELYAQGMSAVALGERYGVDQGTIRYRLKKAGVTLRTRQEANRVWRQQEREAV